jgi:hypothetical protein
MNSSDGEPSSSDDECARNMELVMKHQKITANVLAAAQVFGMCYCNYYLNKLARRESDVTGYDWVIKCLNNHKACYKMF